MSSFIGSTGEEGRALQEILEEVGRRVASAAASMTLGPAAGLAVGVALAAAIKLSKKRKALREAGLTKAEVDIIELNTKLEELYKRREKLLKAREKTTSPLRRRMVDESLRSTDAMIRDLEEALELVTVMAEARRRIATVLGEKEAKKIDELVKRVQRGADPADPIYKLSKEIEERLEKTRLTTTALSQIIGAGGYA